MEWLPVHTSEGPAYDFPDLLFSGIATPRKILSLFEAFADNPCFSPVGLFRGFLEPPSIGVQVTVVPILTPPSGIFNEVNSAVDSSRISESQKGYDGLQCLVQLRVRSNGASCAVKALSFQRLRFSFKSGA